MSKLQKLHEIKDQEDCFLRVLRNVFGILDNLMSMQMPRLCGASDFSLLLLGFLRTLKLTYGDASNLTFRRIGLQCALGSRDERYLSALVCNLHVNYKLAFWDYSGESYIYSSNFLVKFVIYQILFYDSYF